MPLSLISNKSVKTFPWQINVGGIVFYAVPIVSKESRRLVLPRTSCLNIATDIVSSSCSFRKFIYSFHKPVLHKLLLLLLILLPELSRWSYVLYKCFCFGGISRERGVHIGFPLAGQVRINLYQWRRVEFSALLSKGRCWNLSIYSYMLQGNHTNVSHKLITSLK
jgi:hypothetical protein